MPERRIFVAGHAGMVGSAIVRALMRDETGSKIVVRSRQQLDLTCQSAVDDFFGSVDIDQVYLAAAKVGGIVANNTQPAEFIRDNLCIQTNVIHAAWHAGVKHLLFLGSSCIYPKQVAQPMPETSLLTGVLEETNEPYAVAKIAGIKMCESYNRQFGVDYRSVMPTNLYGENDNFHIQNSHVIPGLIRRFHEAKLQGLKEVVVWGSGSPLREFLHVDDMARACVYVMNLDKMTYEANTQPMLSHINVGSGVEHSIADLAQMIARVVGYQGTIVFDQSKPDGTMRKLMDAGRLKELGWEPEISLEEGLADTYQWFRKHQESLRGW